MLDDHLGRSSVQVISSTRSPYLIMSCIAISRSQWISLAAASSWEASSSSGSSRHLVLVPPSSLTRAIIELSWVSDYITT